MKNILIIGCGLIGSSILRAVVHKNFAKKYLFMKSLNQIF